MSRCAFKQRDIARAVRGAERAGIKIARLDIELEYWQDFHCYGWPGRGR